MKAAWGPWLSTHGGGQVLAARRPAAHQAVFTERVRKTREAREGRPGSPARSKALGLQKERHQDELAITENRPPGFWAFGRECGPCSLRPVPGALGNGFCY